MWALFGHVNRYDLRMNTSITSGPHNTLTFTEQTAEITLLAYQATAITVLINILIAMITNSYDRIQVRSHTHAHILTSTFSSRRSIV